MLAGVPTGHEYIFNTIMMKISNKAKYLILILILINAIILRFQAVSNEVGVDSFWVHILANTISEFGYAKWVLAPTSLFGMYPYSEVSAVPFLISGISQLTNLEPRWVVFLYSILLGILGVYTSYVMAGAIMDDDVFKLLVAFIFTTAPAILGYTTWTIPARSLLVILVPLLVYMLLSCQKHLKFIPLTLFFVIFLYATHHLIYFMVPSFFIYSALHVIFNSKKHLNIIQIRDKFTPLIPIAGFFLMFSIPFFGRKFIERSVYSPIYESYIRYMGISIIPAIGALVYLTFKCKKSYVEWFLLLNMIAFTALIYEETYMKWFLPIFLVIFAGMGLINILRSRKRNSIIIVCIFLLTSVTFSGYYQFIHTYSQSNINERYIEDSTYIAGRWMKEYTIGSAISNDNYFGFRITAAAETVHMLVISEIIDFTYGFFTVDLSKFEKYSYTSEEFWFDVGKYEIEFGDDKWRSLNVLETKSQEYNITYMVENTMANGNMIWSHRGNWQSKLVHMAYDVSNLVYDGGKVRVWGLS